MIYLVLGMHKSGTSLVSEILHRSGIAMVDAREEAGDYDSGAFYERPDVRELNQAILGFGDPAYTHPAPPSLHLTEEHRKEIRALLERCGGGGGDWGFKDPRTCLTYPLWREELPEHRIVAVTRSLPQVLSHYRGREPRLFLTWRVVRTWCDYNDAMLRALQPANAQFVVVSYEALMTGPDELARLERFVERPLADVRSRSHYRSRAAGEGRLQATTVLRALMGMSRPAPIAEALDQIRAHQCARQELGDPCAAS